MKMLESPKPYAPSASFSVRASVFAYLGLVLFAFLFFSEPILDNRSFYVWDLSEAYLPVQVDNARLRAAGEIPLWNRHVTLGYPITAETECSGIYPPALLFNAFDSPGRAFTAFILFHYLLALLTTMFLARCVGLGAAGQSMAALVFVFGGSFVAQTVNLPLITTLAWTPLILGLYLRALDRRSYTLTVLAGVVLGLQTVGAHFQISFYTVLLIGVCGAFAGVERFKFAALAASVVVVIGLCLSASQILYTFDLMEHTERSTRLAYDTQMAMSLPPHYLLQLLIPDIFGSEQHYLGGENIYELRVYFGLLALSCLILAWRVTGRDAAVFRVIFAGAVVLSMGRFVGIYHGIGFLPGFASIRAPARLLLVASLAAAILAGMGLDRVMRDGSKLRKIARRFSAAYLVLGVAVGGLAAIRLFPPEAVLSTLARFARWGFFEGPGIHPGSDALADILRSARWTAVLSLLSAGLWLGIARAERPRVARALGAGVLGLLALDLLVANGGFHRFADDAIYTRITPEIGFLRDQGGLWRVHPQVWYDNFSPDPTELVGNNGALFELDSTKIMWSTPHEHLQTYFQPNIGSRVAIKELGLLNVRFILSDRRIAGLVLRKRFVFPRSRYVYENPQWQPRVVVREDWRIIKDLVETKRIIKSDEFQFDSAALLEKFPQFVEGEAIADTPSSPQVEIVEYLAQHIHLTTSLPRPAILIINDLYYPGWNATSNGRPVEVVRTNGLVRGLPLGPGLHEVELRFRPTAFYRGLYLGAVTLLGLLGVCVVSVSRRRRK